MMKKTILIMVLMTLLFIPILGFERPEASNGGILLQNHESVKKIVNQLESVDHLNEIIVLPSTEFQTDDAVSMIRRISHIHPSILKKAADQNIKLKLFTGPLTEQTGFTHLKGIKPRGHTELTWDDIPGAGGSKIAMAKIGYSEKGKSHGSVNLELHEFAHSIDLHVFHSLRSDQDFLDIWKEEAVLLFPNQPYFIDNPEEYFAEVFAMFYLDGQSQLRLLHLAPNTYEYLKELPHREASDLQKAFTFN